jgi:hypothetical protein
MQATVSHMLAMHTVAKEYCPAPVKLAYCTTLNSPLKVPEATMNITTAKIIVLIILELFLERLSSMLVSSVFKIIFMFNCWSDELERIKLSYDILKDPD